MSATDVLPLADVCNKHACANHIAQGKASTFKYPLQFVQHSAWLFIQIRRIRKVFLSRHRTRNLELIADLHSAGISNKIPAYRAAGDTFSSCHMLQGVDSA